MRKLISSRASERFRRPKRGGENLISWLALVATVVFLLGVSQNRNTHAHPSDRQQSVCKRERERERESDDVLHEWVTRPK